MSGKSIITIVAILLCFLSIVSSACSDGEEKPFDNQEFEIKAAPIHEVDIRIAESYPPQVFVYVKGGLADACTAFEEVLVKRRTDTDIEIEVSVRRSRDEICAQVYGYFEKNVNLGTDFVSEETYTVTVNDYQTKFIMQ
ncbi:MAG: hypothetical protein JSU58_01405 [Dehalococcoidales bacterium]|nr:MAG: hypothetical protein JSU58_01405 [Dehalococcoidales bacterium]